jgi:hypothetical protein
MDNPNITAEFLKEMGELAKASQGVFRGPWKAADREFCESDGDDLWPTKMRYAGYEVLSRANSTVVDSRGWTTSHELRDVFVYIAFMDPPTALALKAEIERLRRWAKLNCYDCKYRGGERCTSPVICPTLEFFTPKGADDD